MKKIPIDFVLNFNGLYKATPEAIFQHGLKPIYGTNKIANKQKQKNNADACDRLQNTLQKHEMVNVDFYWLSDTLW